MWHVQLISRLKFTYASLLVLLALVAIAARFINYHEYLYFITDQGRDALVLKEMVEGNLRLIGPTSGLQGFFLGPLWYYIGLPGYVLSNGSPYGIALWYIFLACLSIPLFYVIASTLFVRNPVWGLVLFLLLSFIPGSLAGSTFIWNPLLALPIFAACIISLWKARDSLVWLGVSFFLLGCLLQAEFAYGIFLLPSLYFFIFWIRQRVSLIDYIVAGVAAGITFVPQVLFELRNQFLMTNALIKGIQADQISWWELFTTRPQQLLLSSERLLVGSAPGATILGGALLVLAAGGLWFITRRKTALQTAGTLYQWQIVGLLTVLPYVGYLLWRSNHGNFFDYYITSHFIVLIPLSILGLQQLPTLLSTLKQKYSLRFSWDSPPILHIIQVGFVASVATVSWLYYAQVFLSPNNQAGLKVIDTAVQTTLTNQANDKAHVESLGKTAPQSSIITFTPNFSTAQYDFVTDWKVRQKLFPPPHTELRENDKIVYLIIEPDREIPEARFVPWYEKVTANRILVAKQQVGVLSVETWMQPDFAQSIDYHDYQPSIKELRGW